MSRGRLHWLFPFCCLILLDQGVKFVRFSSVRIASVMVPKGRGGGSSDRRDEGFQDGTHSTVDDEKDESIFEPTVETLHGALHGPKNPPAPFPVTYIRSSPFSRVYNDQSRRVLSRPIRENTRKTNKSTPKRLARKHTHTNVGSPAVSYDDGKVRPPEPRSRLSKKAPPRDSWSVAHLGRGRQAKHEHKTY